MIDNNGEKTFIHQLKEWGKKRKETKPFRMPTKEK